MSVGSVSSATGAATNVSQDQFLKLLVSQLQNQDPLNPVTDTEFISQLATFSQLQQTTNLNASFSEMLRLQQLTQGVGLVGKSVSYTPTGGGAAVSGTVNSVSVDNGSFVLHVGSDKVSLSQVLTAK